MPYVDLSMATLKNGNEKKKKKMKQRLHSSKLDSV